ncbi:MAG: FadR/GntR family transcriptional regulator [Proteobacteria bacterium]|nr:FadR/GntR family transcriptional regulator [Pseudomonadota bacterium]
MSAFKPIKQSRISEEVAEQLKQSILLSTFKAGDKLPSERDLADQFQVSRIAVREALRRLENTGFVATRQGVTGGTFVTDLTFEHLSNAFVDLFLAEKISVPELVEVRLLVEPEIARLSATRIGRKHAKLLKEALEIEDLPVCSLAEDLDRKTAVHYILAEICGNHFLEALERSLMALTRQVVQTVNSGQPFIHPAGMHRSVVEAVLARKPDLAAAEMRRHTIEFGENLINLEKSFRERAL